MSQPLQIPTPDEMKPCSEQFNLILNRLDSALLGRPKLHRLLLSAILARGHVLLEGLPGLGKTALVNCLGQLMNLKFKRIQFTPDLLPGDITGSHILQESADGHRELVFQEGPVFTNILLADEINRASPKSQSALLEAMQERTVTLMGRTMPLPHPFFVLATQNPIELEGTYPLPEAQLDRFLMKLEVAPPDLDSLVRIVTERHRGELPLFEPVLQKEHLEQAYALLDRIVIPGAVASYLAHLVRNTDPAEAGKEIAPYLRYGASPRAAIAIAEAARAWAFLEGRPTVGFSDVDTVAPRVLHHRLVLDYRAKAEHVSALELSERILEDTRKKINRLPEGLASV